jgi:hypothetical protein
VQTPYEQCDDGRTRAAATAATPTANTAPAAAAAKSTPTTSSATTAPATDMTACAAGFHAGPRKVGGRSPCLPEGAVAITLTIDTTQCPPRHTRGAQHCQNTSITSASAALTVSTSSPHMCLK